MQIELNREKPTRDLVSVAADVAAKGFATQTIDLTLKKNCYGDTDITNIVSKKNRHVCLNMALV